MLQARDGNPAGARAGNSPGGALGSRPIQPFSGWLVLADVDEPIDLQRLFPEVEVRVEIDPAGFFGALAAARPGLLVLISPPAEPGDLHRLASWRTVNPGPRAVLMSSHEAVAIRLHALELGFEDAVDLSSDPMEVVGRLSIAGRGGPEGRRPRDRIRVAEGVELDRLARAIRRDGRLMSLRPRELALLEYLALHPGRAFSREELLAGAWNQRVGNVRTVDVYVSWLRAKVEADSARPVHLLTVRGSGYLFDPPRPRSWADLAPLRSPASVNEPPTRR